MAVVAVALLMPLVSTTTTNTARNLSANLTNYLLVKLMIQYWHVVFGLMLLIIFVIIMVRR